MKLQKHLSRTFSSTTGGPDATEVIDCGSWLDPRDSSVVASATDADADDSGGVEFSLLPSGESGSDFEAAAVTDEDDGGGRVGSGGGVDSFGGEGVLDARSRLCSGCCCC